MWGTPVARDDQKSPEAHLAMKQRLLGRTPDAAVTSLTVQAKQWPTPMAADGHKIGTMTKATAERQRAKGHQEMLAGAVVLSGPPDETTPTDGGTTSPPADLNPRFVESLMNVPDGWLTPSTSVATDSFRWWLHAHSLNSPTASASTSGKD